MVSKLSEKKYDPGCSSQIQILIFLPIPDLGSRGQKGTVSRIRNTGFPLKDCLTK